MAWRRRPPRRAPPILPKGRDIADSPAEVDLAPASLVELATAQLSREILGGVLAPGERLVEEQLTRRYRVSRGPVREAMRLLAQQGLVEHSPRRGVRVATLSDRDVDELYRLRDVLERYAVSEGLPPGGPADLGPLRQALRGMRAAARAGRAAETATSHQRFHVALVGLAGQRQLLATYEPVLLKLQLYMAANLGRESRVATPLDGVRRHERLLAALETGDPVTALAALEQHGARRYLT